MKEYILMTFLLTGIFRLSLFSANAMANDGTSVQLKPQAEIYLEKELYSLETMAKIFKTSISTKRPTIHWDDSFVSLQDYLKDVHWVFTDLFNGAPYDGPGEKSIPAKAADIIVKKAWYTDPKKENPSVYDIRNLVVSYSRTFISKNSPFDSYKKIKEMIGLPLISSFVSSPGMRMQLLKASEIAEKVAVSFDTKKPYRPELHKGFFCNVKHSITDSFYNRNACNGVRFSRNGMGNSVGVDRWFYGFLYRRMYTDNLKFTDLQRKEIALQWKNILLDLAKL